MSDENVVALKPTASVMVVTPEIASRWLGKNHKNRNIRNRDVAAYARDMAAGAWKITGEGVKFDRNGNLIDGQHRLLAILTAGVSVPLFVMRGLSADAQDVMDCGIKRGAADALGLSGHKHANILAATARLAMAISAGDEGVKAAYTNSEIAQWVTDNAEVEEAVVAAESLRKNVDLAPSVIAYSWLILSNIDAPACAEFWESIANNSTDGSGDPRNTLIRRVLAARRNGEKLSQQTQIAFIVRAWNAWRKGSQLHVLKVRSGDGKGGTTRVSVPKAV